MLKILFILLVSLLAVLSPFQVMMMQGTDGVQYPYYVLTNYADEAAKSWKKVNATAQTQTGASFSLVRRAVSQTQQVPDKHN